MFEIGSQNCPITHLTKVFHKIKPFKEFMLNRLTKFSVLKLSITLFCYYTVIILIKYIFMSLSTFTPQHFQLQIIGAV